MNPRMPPAAESAPPAARARSGSSAGSKVPKPAEDRVGARGGGGATVRAAQKQNSKKAPTGSGGAARGGTSTRAFELRAAPPRGPRPRLGGRGATRASGPENLHKSDEGPWDCSAAAAPARPRRGRAIRSAVAARPGRRPGRRSAHQLSTPRPQVRVEGQDERRHDRVHHGCARRGRPHARGGAEISTTRVSADFLVPAGIFRGGGSRRRRGRGYSVEARTAKKRREAGTPRWVRRRGRHAASSQGPKDARIRRGDQLRGHQVEQASI